MSGIMFWRADGLVLDANDAFLEMVGYTREDLDAGRVTWDRLTPSEFRELCHAAFEEITASGICAPFEKEYVRKDGSRFPVLVGGARLPQEQDQASACDRSFGDQSGASELDEVQRGSSCPRSHPAMIFMKDVEGGYLHVNSSFEKAIQRSASELIGRTDADFFPKQMRRLTARRIRR
jgi:PAS domain S-box-containing protein